MILLTLDVASFMGEQKLRTLDLEGHASLRGTQKWPYRVRCTYSDLVIISNSIIIISILDILAKVNPNTPELKVYFINDA